MTTQPDAVTLIYKTLRSNWSSMNCWQTLDRGNSVTPWNIILENVAAEVGPVAHAKAFIRHTGSVQGSMGAEATRIHERDAVLIVQLFFPLGKGTDQPNRVCQGLREMLESKTISDIDLGTVHFLALFPREGRASGEFWLLAAELPFTYQETR